MTEYRFVSHRREERIFYGWIVVATAALGLFLGVFPIGVASFTVFFPAFEREFHAGRGAISLAFTISNTVGALLCVVIGHVCDRIGARSVIMASLALFGLVLISSLTIGSRIWELYAFYFVLGMLAPGTNSVPYGLMVSHWFDSRRGLALGLMMIGLGGGAVVIPPLARKLITAYGWRTTFSIFGSAALLVALPIIGAFLKETADPGQARTQQVTNEGFSWREIRSSGDFRLMIVVFVLVSASVQACAIHIAQLMTDAGVPASRAAFAASVTGAALLAARIGSGYFLDRYSAPQLARVVFASAAIGIALLATGNPRATVAGAFLVGLGFGAEADIIAYLLGRYFGLRAFGMAFGFAFGCFVLAGGAGPLLMGFTFDRTGSYRGALAVFFVATVLAAVLVGRLGLYRFAAKGDR